MRISGLDLDFAAPAGAAADLARAASTPAQWSALRPRRRQPPAAGWCRCGAATGATRRRRASSPAPPTHCPTGWPGSTCALRRRRAGYPDLSAHFPAAARMQRATADLLGIAADGARDTRPWLDHGALARRLASAAPRRRARRRPRPTRCPTTTPSCASTATACTRSPSARCTPASSSRGTSASRSSARRCCASKSIWATCTRASSGASPNCRRSTRIAWPAACRATRRWPMPGPTAWRWSRPPAARCPPRAQWLRALMLERERVANHLGDLGALGNDAALAFGAGAVLAPARRLAARCRCRPSATA